MEASTFDFVLFDLSEVVPVFVGFGFYDEVELEVVVVCFVDDGPVRGVITVWGVDDEATFLTEEGKGQRPKQLKKWGPKEKSCPKGEKP